MKAKDLEVFIIKMVEHSKEMKSKSTNSFQKGFSDGYKYGLEQILEIVEKEK